LRHVCATLPEDERRRQGAFASGGAPRLTGPAAARTISLPGRDVRAPVFQESSMPRDDGPKLRSLDTLEHIVDRRPNPADRRWHEGHADRPVRRADGVPAPEPAKKAERRKPR
jgi:hypothetical protein